MSRIGDSITYKNKTWKIWGNSGNLSRIEDQMKKAEKYFKEHPERFNRIGCPEQVIQKTTRTADGKKYSWYRLLRRKTVE